MIVSSLHGQRVINFIHSSVLNKDEIKLRIGRNLKRLRMSRGLTQDQLGAMLKPISVDGSHIAAIESGKGVSDEVLARLCNALKADTWEFHLTEKTPIVKDAAEQQDLFRRREARAVGVAEDTAGYETYKIKEAKKKESLGSEGSKSGVPGSGHRKRRAS